MSGWRDWIHVPWHCPYCICLGFALGQAVTIIILAIGLRYR